MFVSVQEGVSTVCWCTVYRAEIIETVDSLCTIPHNLNDKPDYESYTALTFVC